MALKMETPANASEANKVVWLILALAIGAASTLGTSWGKELSADAKSLRRDLDDHRTVDAGEQARMRQAMEDFRGSLDRIEKALGTKADKRVR